MADEANVTEVTENTKNVIIEAAIFDNVKVRRTSNKVVRSEASNRFEKGLDPNNTVPAVLRACQLIEELDAGDVIGGMIDIYPNPVEPKQIKFEPEKYNCADMSELQNLISQNCTEKM